MFLVLDGRLAVWDQGYHDGNAMCPLGGAWQILTPDEESLGNPSVTYCADWIPLMSDEIRLTRYTAAE